MKLALLSSVLLAAGPAFAAVSQEVYNNMVLYSRYSAAAYDNKGSCRKTPNNSKILQYLNVDSTHTQGVIFQDDTKKEFVLAFRGSNALQDFAVDGQWDLAAYKSQQCVNCKVHSGYYSQWVSIENQIYSALQQVMATQPSYKLVVTGHSMGAGIAAICGPALVEKGLDPTVYTYGQPRPGDKAFADYIQTKLADPGKFFRCTMGDDGIAQAPPASNGYTHNGDEYWTQDPPSAATVTVCKGEEPKGCNLSKPGGFILGSHILYYGKSIGNPIVAGCS